MDLLRRVERVGLWSAFKPILESREFQRTFDISVCGTLPGWLPGLPCVSRGIHQLKALELALLTLSQPCFKSIVARASLAIVKHDLAVTPHSHTGESLLRRHYGYNHMTAFPWWAHNAPKLRQAIEIYGEEADAVAGMIAGDPQLFGSQLVNDSLDWDGLVNFPHYYRSMGYRIPKSGNFRASVIARGFTVADGQIVLRSEAWSEVLGWARARAYVYDFVFGQMNLCAEAMLRRALELADEVGEIRPWFFTATDPESSAYLTERCNWRTRRLMAYGNARRPYCTVWRHSRRNPGRGLATICRDEVVRRQLTVELQQLTALKPESLVVDLSLDTRAKQLTMPLLAGGQLKTAPRLPLEPRALIHIFVEPRYAQRSRAVIGNYMDWWLSHY